MKKLLHLIIVFTLFLSSVTHVHANEIEEELYRIPIGEKYEGPVFYQSYNYEEMAFHLEEELFYGLNHIDKNNIDNGYIYIEFEKKDIPIDMNFIGNFLACFSPYFSLYFDLYLMSENETTISGIEIPYEDLESFIDYCNEVDIIIDYLTESVKDLKSDLDKALFMHDYLVKHVLYAEYYNSFSSSGALYDEIAVCQGYAYAFKYLMNKWGIECHYVISEEMNHGWNIIKINNQYYHVDVTWDDPIINGCDQFTNVYHEYFLLSDEAISNDHYGWESTITCNDKTYDDAFWFNVKSPIVNDGQYYYYFENDTRKLVKRDMKTDQTTTLHQVDYWRTNGNGYFIDTFSGLELVEKTLYFNDSKGLYTISTDGNDLTKYYEVNANGNIYGSMIYWPNEKIVYLHSDDFIFDDEDYYYVEDDVKVPLGYVEFTEESYHVDINDKVEIDAYIYPYYPDAFEFELVLENESIAKVVDDYYVQGLKNGTTTLQMVVGGKVVCETTLVVGTGIEDVKYGDVTGDGKINQLDRLTLSRYLAKWTGYGADKVMMMNSDVNDDGKINQLDRLVLSRYLAKWQGYESLPKK